MYNSTVIKTEEKNVSQVGTWQPDEKHISLGQKWMCWNLETSYHISIFIWIWINGKKLSKEKSKLSRKVWRVYIFRTLFLRVKKWQNDLFLYTATHKHDLSSKVCYPHCVKNVPILLPTCTLGRKNLLRWCLSTQRNILLSCLPL